MTSTMKSPLKVLFLNKRKIFDVFMFQLIQLYCSACLMLGVTTLITLSVSIFSQHWDVSTLESGLANISLEEQGGQWRTLELIHTKLVMIYRDGELISHEPWSDNPSIIAGTRGGLWSTCLDISRVQFTELLRSLPWLGDQCVEHETKMSEVVRVPQWFRVVNIAVSCCLTCLIIISASIMLSILGMWYKQATCILVSSVMFQLATFFFLLHVAINWTHSELRAPGLTLPPLSSLPDHLQSQILTSVSFSSGWSQYLGVAGLIFSLLSSVTLYGLSRVLIMVLSTLPQLKSTN